MNIKSQVTAMMKSMRIFWKTEAEKREILDAYIERMGNCQKIEMQGQHEIMFDQPEECGKILKDFIEKLES